MKDYGDKKIVLITGASSGIGKSCAEYLAQKKDFHIFGTSRKASIPPIKTSDNLEMIKMDVNNDASVEEAINYIFKETKRIDILVNAAGFGISGPIEETSIEKAKEQFETNFFGIHRVCRKVLPILRKQKTGYIISISSIGGLLGLPFQGFYSASKFAVEGYSEALRIETRPFGIHVVLIEPGDTKTSFTDRREKIISTDKDSPYKEYFEKTIKIVENDERNGASPEEVAKLLERIINSPHPKTRYKVGPTSQKFVASLKGKIPDRSIEWILRKYYKVY
ncbi:MAG: short-chain dehydrogenase/reductase [Thermoplasmata archaeon]|nr:MAG: short-chain dehydrogenase/reductase [Thermoplasmata archaeon]